MQNCLLLTVPESRRYLDLNGNSDVICVETSGDQTTVSVTECVALQAPVCKSCQSDNKISVAGCASNSTFQQKVVTQGNHIYMLGGGYSQVYQESSEIRSKHSETSILYELHYTNNGIII